MAELLRPDGILQGCFNNCRMYVIISLMLKNQKGFGHIGIVLVIIVVVAIVGLSGWFVWNKNKASQNQNKGSASSQNASAKDDKKDDRKPYELPDGYSQYINQDVKFSFAYPQQYGDITQAGNGTESVQSSQSAEPDTEYGPGINGKFTMYIHQKSDAAVVSRKYGPTIQLQDGRWIITASERTELAEETPGNQYKEVSGRAPDSQMNGKLTVHTLKGADEGSTMDRLLFVVGDKLVELHPPHFSDGLYGGEQEIANDKSAYDLLFKNVRDSIQFVD